MYRQTYGLPCMHVLCTLQQTETSIHPFTHACIMLTLAQSSQRGYISKNAFKLNARHACKEEQGQPYRWTGKSYLQVVQLPTYMEHHQFITPATIHPVLPVLYIPFDPEVRRLSMHTSTPQM